MLFLKLAHAHALNICTRIMNSFVRIRASEKKKNER